MKALEFFMNCVNVIDLSNTVFYSHRNDTYFIVSSLSFLLFLRWCFSSLYWLISWSTQVWKRMTTTQCFSSRPGELLSKQSWPRAAAVLAVAAAQIVRGTATGRSTGGKTATKKRLSEWNSSGVSQKVGILDLRLLLRLSIFLSTFLLSEWTLVPLYYSQKAKMSLSSRARNLSFADCSFILSFCISSVTVSRRDSQSARSRLRAQPRLPQGRAFLALHRHSRLASNQRPPHGKDFSLRIYFLQNFCSLLLCKCT